VMFLWLQEELWAPIRLQRTYRLSDLLLNGKVLAAPVFLQLVLVQFNFTQLAPILPPRPPFAMLLLQLVAVLANLMRSVLCKLLLASLTDPVLALVVAIVKQMVLAILAFLIFTVVPSMEVKRLDKLNAMLPQEAQPWVNVLMPSSVLVILVKELPRIALLVLEVITATKMVLARPV